MIDLSLRCFQCKVFAYHDQFQGEYGESGYLCLGCIRTFNQRIMEEQKRRFFEEQEWMRAK